MSRPSQVISVLLRIGECTCATIVIALLGRFFYLLDLADAGADGRLIYAAVIAGLCIILSLFLMLPFKYSFYAFPLDGIIFVCTMTAFGLLANLTAGDVCSAFWYWNYWGYYWGSFWLVGPRDVITPFDINLSGCGAWRCVLAFSFMGSMGWLSSALLGLYVCVEHYHIHSRLKASKVLHKLHLEKGKGQQDAQNRVYSDPNTIPETMAV